MIEHYERMKAAEKRQASLEVDLAVAAKTIKRQRIQITALYSNVSHAVRLIEGGDFTNALAVLKDVEATKGKE